MRHKNIQNTVGYRGSWSNGTESRVQQFSGRQDLMYIDTEYFSAMMMVYQYLYWENKQLDALVSTAQMTPVFEALLARRLSGGYHQSVDIASADCGAGCRPT